MDKLCAVRIASRMRHPAPHSTFTAKRDVIFHLLISFVPMISEQRHLLQCFWHGNCCNFMQIGRPTASNFSDPAMSVNRDGNSATHLIF